MEGLTEKQERELYKETMKPHNVMNIHNLIDEKYEKCFMSHFGEDNRYFFMSYDCIEIREDEYWFMSGNCNEWKEERKVSRKFVITLIEEMEKPINE